ncbi:MAG: retron St85 family RNA-directed DNA polymerase [Eubacterium sp.]|nr:retron St85 family RNA-directed DNA polymerase [Eubacterium sp.]
MLESTFNMSKRELYYVSNNIGKHYKKIIIKKKSGENRTLYAPDKKLKYIHRIILKEFLSDYKISACATAYHKGAQLVDNALPHINKKYLLKLDIKDFFPSIMFGRVYKLFYSKFPEEYAKLFAELCCYDDCLVQGAPTSPAVSNIVMLNFDNELEAWCKSNFISYTRYCDDITLSSDEPLVSAYHYVKKLLNKNGFEVNKKKTRFIKHTHGQYVTGIVVNEHLQVTREYRRKLRQDLYYLYKFGARDVILKNKLDDYILGKTTLNAKYMQSLMGRINFVLQVDPDNKEFKEEKTKLINYMNIRI